MNRITGSMLKGYREHLVLSQKDLADLVGVSQALISGVELGKLRPSRKLLRRLRTCAEQGDLAPSLEAFLEYEFRAGRQEVGPEVVRAIPVEDWHARVHLRHAADERSPDSVWLPRLPEGARAFRFMPPPGVLGDDTLAIFRPARLSEMESDSVVLFQSKRDGFARLGRVIVAREGQRRIIQFMPAVPDRPVVTIATRDLDALMLCVFRGRYC